jgi:hypothetical protein
MFTELRKIAKADDIVEKEFQDALEARNYLAHRFLNDQTQNLLTRKGRVETSAVLYRNRKLIFECYIKIVPLILEVMKLKGIDSSFIMQPVTFE